MNKYLNGDKIINLQDFPNCIWLNGSNYEKKKKCIHRFPDASYTYGSLWEKVFLGCSAARDAVVTQCGHCENWL